MKKNPLFKSKKAIILLFLVVYILYFSFGSFHLTKFVTADETIWWLYNRIPSYWDSLLTGNLGGTYINDKPGVSLALISGVGYLTHKDRFKEMSQERILDPNSYKRVEKQDLNIQKNLLVLRLPVLIFNGIFALFLFWLLKNITGNLWVSFWFFSFLLLSPIILGISQIINPDSLLWIFSCGSLLSFIVFLQKQKKSLAIYSALCLGMALLSKYTATIFFPFFIISSFIFFIYKIKDWRENKKPIDKNIKNLTLGTIAIIFGSVVVFAIGMPAVFKSPELLWEGTLGYPGIGYFIWPLILIQFLLVFESILFKNKFSISILNYIRIFFKEYSHFLYLILAVSFLVVLINWMNDLRLFGIKDVKFDMGKSDRFNDYPLYRKIAYEIRPLVFSLTPITLFSLLFFWVWEFFKKSFSFLILTISFFFVVFYAAVIFEGLMVTIRYSVILYPLIMILAAFGIEKIYKTDFFKKINIYLFSLVIIIVSAFNLWFTKPFYFNYTNFLLFPEYLITGSWGYGGYEAAEYINSLPDSENLVIWSDYPGACEFTKGKCYTTHRIENKDIDYFVLTRRGKLTLARKGNVTGARKYYDETPEWELQINNRPDNYVKVLKNKK